MLTGSVRSSSPRNANIEQLRKYGQGEAANQLGKLSIMIVNVILEGTENLDINEVYGIVDLVCSKVV